MKKHQTSNRVYLAALAGLAVFFGLFYLLRGHPAAANFVVQYITTPYKRAVGRLCNGVPFSVAELCWAAGIVFCLWYVVHCARCVVQAKGRRGAVLVHSALGAAVVGLGVYAGFTLLWGFNYYADTFEQQAGIETRPIAVEELAAVTQLFAQKVNETAPLVARDEAGLFCESNDAVLADAATLYDGLLETYPFLGQVSVRPKGMLFSRVMSEIQFTGFFFPFTGEANLNVDAPGCFFPSTVAHELAHVRNIAPEQTANFVAVLACEASGLPAYTYSGYLLGYIHLANALYGADRDAWQRIGATLCPQALADLEYNNAYWAQFSSPVTTVANTAYEGFLQSYSQTLGMKSYGAVVDLLVAHYLPQTA